MKKKTSIPNANRTIEALRSLGYDLDSSIADLVDNSITNKVGATHVSVILKPVKGSFKIRIIDNGCGMTDAILEEAMRFGSNTTYNEGDLGKFGMGMKTASISHCNILTVISKKKNQPVAGYRWDLNHVKKNKEGWTLFQLDAKEVSEILKKEKLDIAKSGTIVLLDDLFILDEEYSNYESDKLAENYVFRIEENLKLHLRMVFHRYLETNKIVIQVNGNSLNPWDPFCRKEEQTLAVALPKNLAQFKIKGYKHPIIIKAFVLPTRESFSSEEVWKEARGLLSWNDAQGYYIYRANRIIRFGGWQGTKAKDEHDKLARLSIDIHPELDSLFRITVNKNKVQFPDALYNHLKNQVNPYVIKRAQSKYRKSGDSKKFSNVLRKNGNSISKLSKEFVAEHQIQTKKANQGNVIVKNTAGSWVANKVTEFMKYGNNNDFEIVSGNVENGMLWKVLCNENEKIKVIINSKHPFYLKLYTNASTKIVTNSVDALIVALAMSELFNKNNQNAHLIDTFKEACTEVLSRLVKEKIF